MSNHTAGSRYQIALEPYRRTSDFFEHRLFIILQPFAWRHIQNVTRICQRQRKAGS